MRIVKVNNTKEVQKMSMVKKVLLVSFIAMVLVITYGVLRQKYLEEYYAENGGFATTIGICDKVGYKKSKQHSLPIHYHFYVDGNKIKVKTESVPYSKPYTYLKKGDSLVISYAVLNPNFSEVVRIKK